MKKLLLIISFATIVLSNVNAQITLHRSDFGNIGDVLFYAHDTTLTSFSVGAPGANKVWDFSAVGSADIYDPSTFKDPLTITGSPVQANLAIDQGAQNGVSYFNIDSLKVRTILPLDNFGLDNQEITITTFPFTYLNSVKDSAFTKRQGTPADFGFSGLPYDSLRISVKINTVSTADGWGTLIVPGRTIAALRVKNMTDVDVTILGKVPILGWQTVPVNPDQHQVLYAWYGNDKKYSLAEAQLDTSGVVTSFSYMVDSIPHKPTTGLFEQTKIHQATIFPNPSNQYLTIVDQQPSTKTITVTDISGRIVLEQTIADSTYKMDTSLLPEGFYIAHIVSANNNEAIKFTVQH